MIINKENNNYKRRFTKQKQSILNIIRNTNTHPDAHWIYSRIVKELPKISLGTIYRNLGILCKENFIRELAFQPNVLRYDGFLDPHHHVMCTNCYKIEDIDSDPNCKADEKFKEKIHQQLKYENLSCEILFTGICPNCQMKFNQL